MTNAELIKALRICADEHEDCEGCAYYKNGCMPKMMLAAADALEAQLPKEGEWVESEDLESALKGKVVCSICGEPQFAIEITNEFLRLKNQKTKYCPNCGAKMIGEHDGSH